MKKLWIPLVFLIFILTACGSAPEPEPAPVSTDLIQPPASLPTEAPKVTSPLQESETTPTFALTSPAFAHEAEIPVKFSCDDADISPELSWGTPPDGTQSLALIMDDPDAPMGTWVHWVLYNIPAERVQLSENLPEDIAVQGTNSWDRLGYGGPCPPSGTHRYYFKLYALDTNLDLAEGASKEELLSAMDGHILAQVELMGTFTR